MRIIHTSTETEAVSLAVRMQTKGDYLEHYKRNCECSSKRPAIKVRDAETGKCRAIITICPDCVNESDNEYFNKLF